MSISSKMPESIDGPGASIGAGSPAGSVSGAAAGSVSGAASSWAGAVAASAVGAGSSTGSAFGSSTGSAFGSGSTVGAGSVLESAVGAGAADSAGAAGSGMKEAARSATWLPSTLSTHTAAPPPRGRRGGPMLMNPAALKFLLGLMMVGANLGIKALFRSARDAARVKELEAENLQQRLDTLRYQINPHFFMNTLNNIHALVDLDPAKAKESIVELSRMMRHILYDAGSPTIPLSQEIEFLQHYVALMRLRYPEGVDISLSLPESDGGAQVPPLVYASFVENAFKHGVSYAAPSFIRISVAVDGGKVLFKCANSRQEAAAQEGGSGIGLENARRRLDLLYGDRYTLHIDQDAARYELLLVLPAHPETPATA